MKNRILLVQMREENKTLLLPHSISVYTPEFPQRESLKNHKTKTSYNSITIKTVSHLNLLPRIIVMYYHLQFFKGNKLFFKHNLSLVLPSYSPVPPHYWGSGGWIESLKVLFQDEDCTNSWCDHNECSQLREEKRSYGIQGKVKLKFPMWLNPLLKWRNTESSKLTADSIRNFTEISNYNHHPPPTLNDRIIWRRRETDR